VDSAKEAVKSVTRKNKLLEKKISTLTNLTRRLTKSHNRVAANLLEVAIASEANIGWRGRIAGQEFARQAAGKSFRAAEAIVDAQLQCMMDTLNE
jgi:hypothetical protein